MGCDHFRTDASYLPDLQAYLDDRLRYRERLRAAVDVDDWARAESMPSDEEINRVRRLINHHRRTIPLVPAHSAGYGPLVIPDLDAWEAWHPRVMADRLAGLDLPWYVAAGWALDLFHGAQTRPHTDLEIAVPAALFPQVAARFDDCRFCVAHDGKLLPGTADTLRASHQTWAWEPATGKWRFDVFREPHDEETWICRRDHRIQRPYTEIIERTPDGIPFLAPEIVLLFKAKNPRDKDEADFHGVLPKLHRRRRRWLNDALGITSPAHPWRDILRASDALERPS